MKESLVVLVVTTILIWLGLGIGGALEESRWRAKLIERDLAEWTVDPKTGETAFTWKESNPNPSQTQP